MPYVRNKITWGSERIRYILSPFLPEDWKPPRGKFSQHEIERIYKEVKKQESNAHKVGNLEIFRIYHDLLKPRIPELREYHNRMITSQSINRTESNKLLELEPRPAIMDPFANMHVLYDSIMDDMIKESKKWRELYKEDPKRYYEKEVYHPVGPVFFPFRFVKRDNDIEMQHCFEDVVSETNQLATEIGLASRLGTTRRKRRSNDDQYGNYEFSESLYSKSVAMMTGIGRYQGYGYEASFVKRSLMFLPEKEREFFEKYVAEYEFRDDKINVLSRSCGKRFNKFYDEIIEKNVHLNREMTWAAIENGLLKPLDMDKIDTISIEGSYVREIIPKENAITWELTDNRKGFSTRKESEVFCINKILGGMWDGWIKKRVRPAVLQMHI